MCTHGGQPQAPCISEGKKLCIILHQKLLRLQLTAPKAVSIVNSIFRKTVTDIYLKQVAVQQHMKDKKVSV